MGGTSMLAHLIAVIHVVSLPLGVTVLVLRARALSQATDAQKLGPVFFWDNLYAGVALVWLGSGLLRAFGGFEKGSDYYLANHVFWTKMLLLAVVLVTEATLGVTFVRWRIRRGRGQPISFAANGKLVRRHWLELWAIVGMVAMAVLMSRGVGVVPKKGVAVAVPNAEGAEGERIYRTRCLTCHQLDGRGLEGKLAADLTDPRRSGKPESALIASVTSGIPNTAMRAFGPDLTAAEIQSVVRYVRKRYGAAPHDPSSAR